MKRLLVSFVALAGLLFLAGPAFAQRGHSPGGGPGGAMGGPGGTSGSHEHVSANSGPGNANSMDAGKKTPDQLLMHNTKLSDKLASLLPKGTIPQQACSEFKNLGQCVAAIHVAHNLHLDFACLKDNMIGIVPATGSGCPPGTGSKKLSLGQSITELKPGIDAKAESKKATKQADSDIKESESRS